MSAPPLVQGTVEPGFEELRDELQRNLSRRGERGAAFALCLRGRLVADLWGGLRDEARGEPWERGTMVMMFSATKGAVAAALALCHGRGLLDYDAEVARYWPEFAQGGKERVTVRQLLGHQAGLPVIDWPAREPRLETLADPDALAPMLAAQRPLWPPGQHRGYHPSSLGFYLSELLRRVDPHRRTAGRFLQDEIAGPLGAELYIGLPATVPSRRVAPIRRQPLREAALQALRLPPGFLRAYLGRDPLTRRAVHNLGLRSPAELDAAPYRAVEVPGGNGIAEARAMARLYEALTRGGGALALPERTRDELTRYPADPPAGRRDRVLNVESVFSLGFSRPSRSFRFGSSDRAFGAPGFGGSFAFADPDRGAGYAYLTNRLSVSLSDDPRELAMRRAAERCLRRIER